MMAYRQKWAWNHPKYINYTKRMSLLLSLVFAFLEGWLYLGWSKSKFRHVTKIIKNLSIKNEENEETAIRSWWCHGGVPLHFGDFGASYFQTDPFIGN